MNQQENNNQIILEDLTVDEARQDEVQGSISHVEAINIKQTVVSDQVGLER
jgi:hypothetical protein